MTDDDTAPLSRPLATAAATLITRREAVKRVTALLGGIALVGGSALLQGCRADRPAAEGDSAAAADFTADEIAFLDEVADTILPETSTPGAKAAATGAFMALMVTDTYSADDQRVFRDGMRRLDERSREMHGAGFMEATPAQRLALLETLDREQHQYTRDREAARTAAAARPPAADTTTADTAAADTAAADTTATDSAIAQGEAGRAGARLPDQRSETPESPDANPAAAITADSPAHYFRMMKELALLGYFTSEIGYTQAMRYVESPGRFDPCAPYAPGERSWAPHA